MHNHNKRRVYNRFIKKKSVLSCKLGMLSTELNIDTLLAGTAGDIEKLAKVIHEIALLKKHEDKLLGNKTIELTEEPQPPLKKLTIQELAGMFLDTEQIDDIEDRLSPSEFLEIDEQERAKQAE